MVRFLAAIVGSLHVRPTTAIICDWSLWKAIVGLEPRTLRGRWWSSTHRASWREENLQSLSRLGEDGRGYYRGQVRDLTQRALHAIMEICSYD